MANLDDLTSRTFTEALNSTFDVESPAGSVPLQLIAVNEKGDVPSLDGFSLIFRGPRTPVLAQTIYRFTHPKLGAREMFSVPIGPDEQGMCYEVVFNRIREAKR